MIRIVLLPSRTEVYSILRKVFLWTNFSLIYKKLAKATFADASSEVPQRTSQKKNADAVNESFCKAGGFLAYISDLLSEGF